MAARTEEHTEKSYKVSNLREYNESLVRRGDITFWFSEDVIARWQHDNGEVRRGRPFVYSDLAIETLLTLRELFRLPYRQTEGLGRALAKLMDVDLAIPHHTSLVKRAAKLNIGVQLADVKGPVEVVVDSTGLSSRSSNDSAAREAQKGFGKHNRPGPDEEGRRLIQAARRAKTKSTVVLPTAPKGRAESAAAPNEQSEPDYGTVFGFRRTRVAAWCIVGSLAFAVVCLAMFVKRFALRKFEYLRKPSEKQTGVVETPKVEPKEVASPSPPVVLKP